MTGPMLGNTLPIPTRLTPAGGPQRKGSGVNVTFRRVARARDRQAWQREALAGAADYFRAVRAA